MGDLYSELGVAADASPEEIERAAKRRIKETHPDAGGNAEDFDRTVKALTILRDPRRREQYDATGDTELDPEDLAWAQAMTLITGKLMAVFQNPQVDLARLNVVEAIGALIREDQRRNAANISDTEKAVVRLNKGKARLKRKDGQENALTSVIDSQIRQYQAGIAAARREERMFATALELLKDYDYEVDPPPVQRPNAPTSTSGLLFGKPRHTYFGDGF